MNIKIIISLLVISCLFISESECIPIYLNSHTVQKLLPIGLIGASAAGFAGWGIGLGISLQKFKEIHDNDDHDFDEHIFDKHEEHEKKYEVIHKKKDNDDKNDWLRPRIFKIKIKDHRIKDIGFDD